MVRASNPWCVSQFFLLQNAQPASFNVYRNSSVGGSRISLEVKNTPSYSAKVKNENSHTSASRINLHAAERDSFIFACFNLHLSMFCSFFALQYLMALYGADNESYNLGNIQI